MAVCLKSALEAMGVADGFLRAAESLASKSWRRGLSPLKRRPRNYVFAVGPWVGGYWSRLDTDWKKACDGGRAVRWPELEAIIGWADPLEVELGRVRDA